MDHSFMQPSIKKYVSLALVSVAFSFFALWWTDGRGILLVAMFWGVVFFTPLALDFVPILLNQPATQVLQALQGKHYVFGRTPLRIYYAAGEVWVATQDLYQALELPLAQSGLERLVDEQRSRCVPGTNVQGIAESQLPGFLRYSRAQEKDKFLLWFQRQVAYPIHTKVARGLPIAEQVD